MNIKDAAYHTVHDFPGGAEVLALRLGKAHKTLLKEVAPGPLDSAKFGLLDANKAMAMSRDYRMLHAIAVEHGFMAVPLPSFEHDASPGTAAVATAVATLAREFAGLMGEVVQDLADQTVTDNELRRIEQSCGHLVAGVQRLLQHVGAMNLDLKRRRGIESEAPTRETPAEQSLRQLAHQMAQQEPRSE
jgi:hypothetical protein